MLRFTPPFLALLAAALAVSCGSRTDLGDGAAAPAGSGGSASTTTSSSSATSSSSSTSSSGAGGAPALCLSLQLTGPPISTPPGAAEHGSHPILASATAAGDAVSVVLARQGVEGPVIPPFRITAATFSPWASWPDSLGPDAQVSAQGGDAFAAAPAPAASQPGVSALFAVPGDATVASMIWAASAAPGTSYDPYPAGADWVVAQPAWAVALARGVSSHLAAYEVGAGSGAAFLNLGLIDDAGQSVSVLPAVACGAAPFPAALAPAPGGYTLATASGRKFGECGLDNGIPGPAAGLQISHVDAATQKVLLAATLEEPDPLAHVALAPAAAGAWVVWQNDGASAELPAPIRAARLDDTGALVGPPFDVTQDGQSSGPFTAAALGGELVVAWVDALDPSTPTLRLDLFDAQGHPLGGGSINTAPSWLYDPSLSLLASPDGQAVLLAWSDLLSTEPAAAAVRVARFSCGAPGGP
jgi:hypothetical protein